CSEDPDTCFYRRPGERRIPPVERRRLPGSPPHLGTYNGSGAGTEHYCRAPINHRRWKHCSQICDKGRPHSDCELLMNPNDVFPPRNLPAPAVPWAREMESRVISLEVGALASGQDLNNSNRTTATVTNELARQLYLLEDFLEDLEELYRSIPKTYQTTNRTAGFASSETWVTVNTIPISFPDGSNHVEISAFGAGAMKYADNGTLATLEGRMVIRNGSGPYVYADEFYVAGGWMSILIPQNTRSLDGEDDFNVEFQVRAADSSAYPADSRNYANLTVIATFTG